MTFSDDVIDPVCGMTITRAQAPFTSVHSGTTYYLCSVKCMWRFDADGDAYAAVARLDLPGWSWAAASDVAQHGAPENGRRGSRGGESPHRGTASCKRAQSSYFFGHVIRHTDSTANPEELDSCVLQGRGDRRTVHSRRRERFTHLGD